MGMGEIGDSVANNTNDALAEREKELISETTIDWNAMRPQIGSESDYQKLMDAVQKATDHNETVAAVVERLEKLGTEGLALAKKVRGLIPV